MEKRYYISSMRSNAVIDETMTGSFITIGGLTYRELTRAPRGKRIFRKFTKEDKSERIVVYK